MHFQTTWRSFCTLGCLLDSPPSMVWPRSCLTADGRPSTEWASLSPKLLLLLLPLPWLRHRYHCVSWPPKLISKRELKAGRFCLFPCKSLLLTGHWLCSALTVIREGGCGDNFTMLTIQNPIRVCAKVQFSFKLWKSTEIFSCWLKGKSKLATIVFPRKGWLWVMTCRESPFQKNQPARLLKVSRLTMQQQQ